MKLILTLILITSSLFAFDYERLANKEFKVGEIIQLNVDHNYSNEYLCVSKRLYYVYSFTSRNSLSMPILNKSNVPTRCVVKSKMEVEESMAGLMSSNVTKYYIEIIE